MVSSIHVHQHMMVHCKVGLVIHLVGTRDIDLVILVLTGQTNFTKTLDKYE